MLEGLEVSEIDYTNVDEQNRYDSEFFQQKFLKAEHFIKSKPYFKLGKKYKVTDGEHGSVVFQESGVKYLTAENIKDGYVDITKIRYVNKNVDDKNARARVVAGDVLISIKGTLGQVAVAEQWLLPANMNRDVAIFKPLNKDVPSSEYLCLFLISKYGLLQSLRVGSGGVQQMLTLERLRQYIIPIVSLNFDSLVSTIYKKTQELKILAQITYFQAETLLLEAVGLTNFEPSKEPVNIKSFKESFGSTGRLDAEYYQKRYEDYLELVYSYEYGYEKTESACSVKDGNYSPKDDIEYKYIELSNIGNSGDIKGCTTELGKDLPSRARRKVNTNDVVISSIEGSLQSCGLITLEYDNALCSTGFYIINSKKINSETLLVLFKSELMQNILKQNCSGTILTGMNKNEFLNIPIPLIEISIQQQIAQLVKESFRLKAESERLLALAKQAVETAIEEGEEKAMETLNKINENAQSLYR